jgi:hypothetical protein
VTLIVAVGNRDQFIQVSDRRITTDFGPDPVEMNKAIVFLPGDARLLIGFSGLGYIGSFNTRQWVAQTLIDCTQPDYLFQGMLERLAQKATEEFLTNIEIQGLAPEKRRLAILFSGFIDTVVPSFPIQALVSNFHHMDGDFVETEWQPKFDVYHGMASEPDKEDLFMLATIGARLHVRPVDRTRLTYLARSHIKANAIRDKLVGMCIRVADDVRSRDSVGKQLTSIIIPRDINFPITSAYHSRETKPETYMPDLLVTRPRQMGFVQNIVAVPIDPDTLPLSVPMVPKNQPCPCKSGKKYKDCHGSKQLKNLLLTIAFTPDA